MIFVALMSFTAADAIGQPEIRYPNPAYQYWYEPCGDTDIFGQNYYGTEYGMPFPFSFFNDPPLINDHICFVNPFGREEYKQRTYGVALNLTRRLVGSHDVDSLFVPIDRDITVDIVLYNFTPGDSNVRLVKSQTFMLEENQRPDVMMVYKNLAHNLGHEVTDSLIICPTYEFYFDSPVDVDGYYYVGVNSMDRFFLWAFNIRSLEGVIGRGDGACCHPGYQGFVDMNKGMLVQWNAECSHRLGLEWGYGWYMYDAPGVIAPLTDTIFTSLGQGLFPITMPQGYQNANGPTAESGRVRLLPNPARESVTVMAEDAIRHVELADMAGRVLVAKQCDGGEQRLTLNVGTLPKGVYVAKVKTATGVTSQKLVIE